MHPHRVGFILQKEVEMVRAFRNDTLAFLESSDSLVKVGAKVRVVGTGERELEFGLLRINSS